MSPKANAQSSGLQVTVGATDGSYRIGGHELQGPVVSGTSAAKVDGHWLRAADYPQHIVTTAMADGKLGKATDWTLRYTGRAESPDILVHLRAYLNTPFGEVQVAVRNSTGHSVEVQEIRLLAADGANIIDLGGPATANRVLSDSFSEDRPAIQIRDLTHAENELHRAVGSQLIYNQQSHQSWFIAALTSEKFLSVLRLHMTPGNSSRVLSYEIDSTGTTELLKENSLEKSPEQDRIELSLPVAPGGELSSERMLFSVGKDYLQQLETYGIYIRDLHHARVSAPTPLGWWSWTAYYFGLNEATALTNAQWLSQNLRPLGYDYFHMDEGYQYARGEYGTPDATLFPHGVAALERAVMTAGLTPGIWTAPFEVSERSSVYIHHPEWLVHNAKGEPIHIGTVVEGKDKLFALDATHPGAQAYLRSTYSTLANDWGIRYIKMDFMEDSAVEGYYHQPHTTALEAQRIGIQTIREAVGEGVLLDKDGCELLNPVGLVDMGRISQDTGHTFSSSKDAASGIAARYYMNRNYFLADPDAFTVSTQTVDDQSWHGGAKSLTLDEAKVSIALSAVSGGLFEIGDDLPTLGASPERLELLKNQDLLDMARLGRASVPLDLMSYQVEDEQPSLFLLKQDNRQSILTVFNWTDKPRSHSISLAALGLAANGSYAVTDVLDRQAVTNRITGTLELAQPPHSVRVMKVVDTLVAPQLPKVTHSIPTTGHAGDSLQFSAKPVSENDAIVRYQWEFGDGVTMEGSTTTHAYTHEGTFKVTLLATGLGAMVSRTNLSITITGAVSTHFRPETKRRLE